MLYNFELKMKYRVQCTLYIYFISIKCNKFCINEYGLIWPYITIHYCILQLFIEMTQVFRSLFILIVLNTANIVYFQGCICLLCGAFRKKNSLSP